MKHKFAFDSTTNTATFSLPTEDVALKLESCKDGIMLDKFMTSVYVAGYERAVVETDDQIRQSLLKMRNVILRGFA